MSQNTENVIINGKELICPVCGSNEFKKNKYLLNTGYLTLFNAEWLDREAETYTCRHCSHIIWFNR